MLCPGDCSLMDELDTRSDAELVTLITQGDAGAISNLLVQRCGPGLKYLAEVKFRTLKVEFNELVSEVYIRLRRNQWQALRDFRGSNDQGQSCKLTNYVLCIAARLLSRKMSKTVKETTGRVSLDELGDVPVPPEDSGHKITIPELVEMVMTLPDPVDRAVLLLYKVEGKSVEEVAEQLGTSPGNVYTRTSRAIKALRDQLRTEEWA